MDALLKKWIERPLVYEGSGQVRNELMDKTPYEMAWWVFNILSHGALLKGIQEVTVTRSAALLSGAAKSVSARLVSELVMATLVTAVKKATAPNRIEVVENIKSGLPKGMAPPSGMPTDPTKGIPGGGLMLDPRAFRR